MRVAFAGTPAFAATVLAALVEAGFAVPLVLTRPDRPKGRGLKRQPSAVKALALARGLDLHQPASLKTDADRAGVLAVPVDVLVVAAYGLLLPAAVLGWPRHGGLNVHASILPRWRGAAPIERSLLAGDVETGVTIMRMDAGLDTGPIIDVVRTPVTRRETAATLTVKLATTGAAAIVAALRRLEREGALAATPQPREGACYAPKIDKIEATIDWRASADTIDRQIRAFDPVPGAGTTLAGEAIKLWKAAPAAAPMPRATPGTVLAVHPTGMLVGCGEGALRIDEVQPAGGRRMSIAAFIAGRRIVPGARLGSEQRGVASAGGPPSGGH
jgi:methionyl-tRNA formyltransferase